MEDEVSIYSGVEGVFIIEIKSIPVDEINPAPYNPRKDLQPDDPEYQKLKRSLDQFGYVEPIIWNEETGWGLR